MRVEGAPAAPGVYYFLSADRELLYVGKAGDLRARLAQHHEASLPGEDPVRLRGMYARAAECRWEVLADEPEAVRREADLLVALQPAYNAAGSMGGWSDVAVDDGDRDGDGRVRCGSGLGGYGTFPHLGPSTPVTAGYLALLRLLWAAGTARPVPAALARRGPPPAVVVPGLAERRRPLHDLLRGTSRRLLTDLARTVEGDSIEPYRRPGLRRDLEAADAFFRHGPARLRDLRRRHGLGTGHVTRDQVREALLAEVHELLGDDVHVAPAPDPSLLGRRAARSLPRTTAER